MHILSVALTEAVSSGLFKQAVFTTSFLGSFPTELICMLTAPIVLSVTC